MRLSKRSARHSCITRAADMVEPLESRQLLSVALAMPLSNAAGNPGTTSAAVDLTAAFSDPDITVSRLATPQGNVDVALYVKDAPLSAANFLNYVTSGRYDNTIFHRYEPGFVLQGGSVKADGGEVEAFGSVRNEFSASRSNVAGTVAFAKLPSFQDLNGNGQKDAGELDIPGGGPDSATAGFFFNLGNNAANLDQQNGGFTVFGRVLGNGMTVVENLAALPFQQRLISTATVIDDLTFTASSSNPALVTPQVSGKNLALVYGAGAGTADITVTATDVNGQAVSDTFRAGVGQLDVEIDSTVASSLTFTDADGTKGTIGIAKGGRAVARFAGTDLVATPGKRSISLAGGVSSLLSVQAFDTTTNSTLSIKGKGGDNLVRAGGLTTVTPLKTLDARSLQLVGDATIGGTVRSVAIGSLGIGRLTIGGTPEDRVPVSLDVGQATNYAINSGSAIASIKAGTFENDAASIRAITAPSIGNVSSRGDFTQGLTASSGAIGDVRIGGNYRGAIAADSVKNLSIKGNLASSTVILDAPFAAKGKALGSLRVGGDITATTVSAVSNIGPVSAANVSGSAIAAGLATLSPPVALPSGAGAFTQAASIASFTSRTYAGSNLAASNLGKVALGTLTTENGGRTFGIAADRIGAISGAISTSAKFNFRKLDDPASFGPQFAASGLNLNNAVIRVF